MQILFLGPPGSGKGTQSKRVADWLKVPHFSSGDIFRQAMEANTELGKQAKEFMETGRLVPDDILISIFTEKLSAPDSRSGFILDGFPRTINQAIALDELLAELRLPLTSVIYLEVSDEILLKRLSGRLSCPNKACGAVYNLSSLPPKQDKICDLCGSALLQRHDDQPEVMKKRLAVYHEQTEPLVSYYENKHLLERIDGSASADAVYSEITHSKCSL
jgi:adenylate kinase